MGGSLRVTLELDDDDPPCGRMLVADQPVREFCGYVQLISALEAVRGAREGSPTGSADDRSSRGG